MSRFRDHENGIEERTFEFAVRIIELSRRTALAFVERNLTGQLLRAGTSVGSNVAEAASGQSRADFRSKCWIALKEARESKYWLRLLHRTSPGFQKQTAPLIREAEELIAILTTIIKRST